MTTDDERVADLLRRLDDEPAGPPRLDLPRAIREARRRRRNRRVAAAGAVALGVLAVAVLPGALRGDGRAAPAPAVSPPPRPSPTTPFRGVCTAALLPVLGDPFVSEVTGGDPTGRWLVGRQTPTGRDYRPLIWEGNRVREVDIPGMEQELTDVNRDGLAVGASWSATVLQEAWAVRDGEPVRLLGARYAKATGVNDAGRIVGYRKAEAPGGLMARIQPVIWDSYQARAVDLPLPGPRWSGAPIDIDEDGTVVAEMGQLTDTGEPGDAWVTVVWRPGAERPELLPLPRLPDGTASRFSAVSVAGGWVTGTAYRDVPGKPRSAAKEYAVRIDLRSGTVDVLPDRIAAATGNGQGWQAGVLSSHDTALVTDTRIVKLPGLDKTPGSANGWVRSLSDDGRALGGQLQFDDHGPRPVRWTCR